VDLIGVIGGPTDIVLDQASPFEHRHLREVSANLHAHHVSTQWSTVALFALSALDQFCVCFDNRLTTRPIALAITIFSTAATTPISATATIAATTCLLASFTPTIFLAPPRLALATGTFGLVGWGKTLAWHHRCRPCVADARFAHDCGFGRLGRNQTPFTRMFWQLWGTHLLNPSKPLRRTEKHWLVNRGLGLPGPPSAPLSRKSNVWSFCSVQSVYRVDQP